MAPPQVDPRADGNASLSWLGLGPTQTGTAIAGDGLALFEQSLTSAGADHECRDLRRPLKKSFQPRDREKSTR